jgi:integrase
MPLTDKQISNLKPEAKSRKFFDGGGMYLEVAPGGGKLWRLKYRVNGVEKRISLGAYPEVSLLEARDKTHEHRKTIREGSDPSVERRRAQARARRLFADVGREWFAKEKDSWTEHHRIATESRLNRLVYPRIGTMPIDTLEPPDILALCNAVKTSISVYMARLTRSLCGRIFRYAVRCGYIPSDPSRDLSDALPPHRHKPMPALVEPKDIARLLKAIDAYDGDFRTCCALKLLPLLMVRTGELRAAEWTEFDFDDKLWRIPGHKMKMG